MNETDWRIAAGTDTRDGAGGGSPASVPSAPAAREASESDLRALARPCRRALGFFRLSDYAVRDALVIIDLSFELGLSEARFTSQEIFLLETQLPANRVSEGLRELAQCKIITRDRHGRGFFTLALQPDYWRWACPRRSEWLACDAELMAAVRGDQPGQRHARDVTRAITDQPEMFPHEQTLDEAVGEIVRREALYHSASSVTPSYRRTVVPSFPAELPTGGSSLGEVVPTGGSSLKKSAPVQRFVSELPTGGSTTGRQLPTGGSSRARQASSRSSSLESSYQASSIKPEGGLGETVPGQLPTGGSSIAALCHQAKKVWGPRCDDRLAALIATLAAEDAGAVFIALGRCQEMRAKGFVFNNPGGYLVRTYRQIHETRST